MYCSGLPQTILCRGLSYLPPPPPPPPIFIYLAKAHLPVIPQTGAPFVEQTQHILGLNNINMNDLKRLVNHLEGGKIVASAQALSPFIITVREVPLPKGYKNTTDRKSVV